MVINQKFFISGFKSLVKLSPNMDSLVALGSSASFIYSVFVFIDMTNSVYKNELSKIMENYHDLYFESAAMILVLITVGKILESYSKGKTTTAVNSLQNLSPKKVMIIKEEKEVVVDFEKVAAGDIFVVKPGDIIPVDGIIVKGESSVNEASITGESIPVEKKVGSEVVSGTQNLYGAMQCKATNVGEETTLSKIVKIVNDASSSKAPIAKIADKVSGVFVPVVILISIITIIVWLLSGENISFALSRGISVLVISCPCSLGLATPVAIMVGNGVAAKNGILFKNATVMEQCGKSDAIVLDKTGTITKGEPTVTDIIPISIDEKELLLKAYLIEKKSEHPLAKAVIDYVEKTDKINNPSEIENFCVVSGSGVSGTLAGNELLAGNVNFIIERCKNLIIEESIKKEIERLSESGKTPLLFAEENKLVGIIAVADVIKEDSPKSIEEMKKNGLSVFMLTGDNQKTAEYIANKVGIERIIANVKPEQKEKAISELQKTYKNVIMVGDGINDAPSLTRADIGMAVGNGSDIAIDAANIVVLNNSLTGVINSVKLSKKILNNIKTNLFFAFCYNSLGIPLAAGVFINIFGWKLNPMVAAAAMSLSSFCVVTNALRLNLVKFNKDKKIIQEKEESNMEKTFKTKGMMCEHCENHVKNAIMKLTGVESVSANHQTGLVVVKMTSTVDDNEIINAIKSEGYEVL